MNETVQRFCHERGEQHDYYVYDSQKTGEAYEVFWTNTGWAINVVPLRRCRICGFESPGEPIPTPCYPPYSPRAISSLQ